jgi:hypothetical protein
MHLALTTFNVHLDDGPVDPLANWLQTLGPEQCLQLRKVNVWDLHNSQGTLLGSEATKLALEAGEQSKPLVLRQLVQIYWTPAWLHELTPRLEAMGLGVMRFCIVDGASGTGTSRFALVRLDEVETLDRGISIYRQQTAE